MTATKVDLARLQTLEDAIVAATQAVASIPSGEMIEDGSVHFVKMPDGGWVWSIVTVKYHRYGNDQATIGHRDQDYAQNNTRLVIKASMRAQMSTVDHLHEAMKNDSRLVLPAEATGHKCVGCGRQVGAYHDLSCRVAYPS